MKLKEITLILAFILLLDSINNIPREASRNIANEINVIINDNKLRNLEVNENYISVLYGGIDCEYRNGFENAYRNNISYIESGDFKYNATENFTIKAGSEIKIYFLKSITSLERFFSFQYDDNVANIEYIDFSHFDLSLITSFARAFDRCSSLKSIKFSDNISSIIDLQYMFFQCTSLESINLSNFKTSSVTNVEGMFYRCTSLKSIDLSNFDTPSLTNIKEMFRGCFLLESIDLSSFNTSSTTDMNSMFYQCSSLKSINLSNFDTSSVTDMTEIFFRCIQLESIDLSNFNTTLVTRMSGMFYQCSSLKSINLSNFDTSSVTTMNRMFYGCSSLLLVDISNFNMNNVKDCIRMFYDCENLTYIKLLDIQSSSTFLNYTQNERDLNNKDNLTVCQSSDIIINLNAIYSCCDYNIETNLCYSGNYITLYYNEVSNYDNGFINAYRNNISYIFVNNKLYRGNNQFSITPKSKLEIYFLTTITSLKNFFSFKYDDKVVKIESIDFSHLDLSLVTSFEEAFYECNSLKSIIFSNNISSILDLRLMFFNCNSLELIDLTNFNTSLVTNMNAMFNGCSSLISINLSNFDTSSVTDMNAMFNGCSSLQSINLSYFNTSSVTDMNSMFNGCSSLQLVDISNFNMKNLENCDNMFYNSRCRWIK